MEGADEDFGKELAERLQEENVDMIIDLIKILGRRVVWDFFKQTQDIESKGGMMTNNGARRRTAGGVMMHLLRITEDQEISKKAKKLFNKSQKERKRVLQADEPEIKLEALNAEHYWGECPRSGSDWGRVILDTGDCGWNHGHQYQYQWHRRVAEMEYQYQWYHHIAEMEYQYQYQCSGTASATSPRWRSQQADT